MSINFIFDLHTFLIYPREVDLVEQISIRYYFVSNSILHRDDAARRNERGFKHSPSTFTSFSISCDLSSSKSTSFSDTSSRLFSFYWYCFCSSCNLHLHAYVDCENEVRSLSSLPAFSGLNPNSDDELKGIWGSPKLQIFFSYPSPTNMSPFSPIVCKCIYNHVGYESNL